MSFLLAYLVPGYEWNQVCLRVCGYDFDDGAWNMSTLMVVKIEMVLIGMMLKTCEDDGFDDDDFHDVNEDVDEDGVLDEDCGELDDENANEDDDD